MKRSGWALVLVVLAAVLIRVAALEIVPHLDKAANRAFATSTPRISPQLFSPASASAAREPLQRTATPTIGARLPQPKLDNWQPSLPLRAAFYYPWYPENWTLAGNFPATVYVPALGFYDSGDTTVIRQHIADLEYGHVAAGIASWWGPGTLTDLRFPKLLAAARGQHVRWAVYYEQEGSSNPSVEDIASNLRYLYDHYGHDSTYLHIDGRFVVFVYADPKDRCQMAERWKLANQVNAYIVLKVFEGYLGCQAQPDGWHQYGPNVPKDAQGKFSFSISPGFFKYGHSPLLPRDLDRWRRDIRDMIRSNARFQLIISFNEWGEGTAVEPAKQWASPSGFGAYLDALHCDGQDPSVSTGSCP